MHSMYYPIRNNKQHAKKSTEMRTVQESVSDMNVSLAKSILFQARANFRRSFFSTTETANNSVHQDHQQQLRLKSTMLQQC